MKTTVLVTHKGKPLPTPEGKIPFYITLEFDKASIKGADKKTLEKEIFDVLISIRGTVVGVLLGHTK